MRTSQRLTNTSKSDEIIIWTIGHSNRSQEAFLKMLEEHEIEVLVDIRRFPTSKVEHFRKEAMEQWVSEHGIEYVWLGDELGGYRHGGYKAYMRTKQFKDGIKRLSEIARQRRTCMMCLEPNPKYCHRRFVSAYLESEGMKALNIIAKGQTSLLGLKVRSGS